MSEREQLPAGTIENGREHFRRLAEHYDFECEGGPLHNCTDFISARQCFEHLAEYAQARARIAEQEKRELLECLQWYERYAKDVNRRGDEGHCARNAIANDAGKRARALLAKHETTP